MCHFRLRHALVGAMLLLSLSLSLSMRADAESFFADTQRVSPQMLLGLYFFLTGMMVRSQPILWLLPLVSCLSALVAGLTNAASQAILPFYR